MSEVTSLHRFQVVLTLHVSFVFDPASAVATLHFGPFENMEDAFNWGCEVIDGLVGYDCISAWNPGDVRGPVFLVQLSEGTCISPYVVELIASDITHYIPKKGLQKLEPGNAEETCHHLPFLVALKIQSHAEFIMQTPPSRTPC